ncbi:unnamed protein product [Plutella xylostella]|uniref:(diamondback moth) hypothetical protein n=1 Tax=Plutella xylostella TaxID=51655 RepID=A0A8S4DFL9_PLUXY|nr:unnamed protein product [Plutella xylostella]
MTGIPAKDGGAEKTLRPVRNRRYTRRSLVAGQRPQKRLFTPEIKRYLKDWLVRRRENPYPNREEKKCLAHETGLTYIQICNWFANWRRKLKNVNEERNQQTWGHLIRTYNHRAQGNVEQFSICSEDSIWSERGAPSLDDVDTGSPGSPGPLDEDFQESDSSSKKENQVVNNNNEESGAKLTSPLLLSKWLESAARFQPSETNYSWWAEGRKKAAPRVREGARGGAWSRHGRDEVEAAVALTALASAAACRVAAP